MDKEKIEHSTRSRDNRRIFIYSAGNRRGLDKGIVRGKYWMVMDWYRSGNEKESGKMYAEGRRKRGLSYSESC